MRELETAPDIEVVVKTNNGLRALRAVEQSQPDMLLLAIELPDMSGLRVLERVRNDPMMAATKVVFLTPEMDRNVVFRAMVEGADGYVLTFTDMNLIHALRAINEDEFFMCPVSLRAFVEATRTLTHPRKPIKSPLTAREREILAMMAAGRNQHEIASRLCLAYHTVRTHCRNAYRKLEVSGGRAAIAKAARQGWLEESEG